MHKIKPTVMKTKAFKALTNLPPMFEITPKNKTPEEIKQAKLIQSLLEYQWKSMLKRDVMAMLGLEDK